MIFSFVGSFFNCKLVRFLRFQLQTTVDGAVCDLFIYVVFYFIPMGARLRGPISVKRDLVSVSKET